MPLVATSKTKIGVLAGEAELGCDNPGQLTTRHLLPLPMAIWYIGILPARLMDPQHITYGPCIVWWRADSTREIR
jgi:hypothetical protein